ncbi:hypothetical protein FH972_011235 [Carpinus fangiana]|uniref:Uncharacterized protein n=1 Tax=Carpinus fangiana TaxID=176857 RepID=A0A660KTP6_9ROSI|nr:hypothetical protein FH972_011235 [Carpinus fangiana]
MAANGDDHHETKMMKPEGHPSSDDEEMETWEKYNYFRLHGEHGEPVDPRLLSLLVYFRELFAVAEEVFKKIFQRLHDEISELLQKFGSAISRVKSDRMRVRTTQRSLSIGSPRTLCRDGDLDSPSTSRLEYFKVRLCALMAAVNKVAKAVVVVASSK